MYCSFMHCLWLTKQRIGTTNEGITLINLGDDLKISCKTKQTSKIYFRYHNNSESIICNIWRNKTIHNISKKLEQSYYMPLNKIKGIWSCVRKYRVLYSNSFWNRKPPSNVNTWIRHCFEIMSILKIILKNNIQPRI